MEEPRISPVPPPAPQMEATNPAAQAPEENSKPTTARPPSKYVRDFESFFVPIRTEMLRNKAQSGQLRHCQFRSLCWRYFLKCLPEQYNDWLTTCEIRRRQYEALRKKNLSSIKSRGNESEDDKPTSESNRPPEGSVNSVAASDPSSARISQAKMDDDETAPIEANNDDDDGDFVKLSLQCDYKNVLKTIERDVVRTFPDMEFFRQTEMQEILSNILFNFATENPHLSYKQGMHELLATLLYVAHTDSQNCLINYEGDYANETIACLLNIKYLEHDVYLLFSHLMKSIESWYQNDEMLPAPEPSNSGGGGVSESGLGRGGGGGHNFNRSSTTRTASNSTSSKLTSSRTQQTGSVLGSKLMKISVNIVKAYDSELFYHLEALQIAPQIYGIRWMRLLFGREFEFLDLLTVWDAIICDQDSMSLVDYVFASMLITIREELVNGDYTHCLNNLMRYQFKDVTYVIKLALYLRDPINYSQPKAHNQRYTGGNQHLHHQRQHPQRSSSQQQLMSSVSSLTSKLSQQYISDKLQHPLAGGVGAASRGHQAHVLNPMSTKRFVSATQRPPISGGISSSTSMRQLSSTVDANKQRLVNRGDALSSAVQGGIGYLAQQASRNLSSANNSAKSKILPNINKFVTSIGQNLQDKTNFPPSVHWQNPTAPSATSRLAHNQQMPIGQRAPASSNSAYSSHRANAPAASAAAAQQYHHVSPASDMILSADNPIIKEYEMREMQSNPATASASASRLLGDQKDRFPLGKIGTLATPNNAFDVSTESYDDLHSIVDYCWRLLSEQIDSLQRCLPKEKGLHSEDEIFVALAQLKKVRDVLKGSLKLEDELESAGVTGSGGGGGSTAVTGEKS